MKVRLGDVCVKDSSGIAQKDLNGHSGEYPIYGASGYITSVDFYQQEQPYIAVVKDGAGVGRIMSLPAKSSVIGTMQYILPKNDIDIAYLAYAMEYMNLAKYYTGATIPHIYFKDYQNEMLPLPSLEEQRHIAAVLDKVSELISKRKAQLDKLDELVKSRFVEMFGDENSMQKWGCCKISEISEVFVGVVIKPAQYYTTDKEQGVPAFRSLNIGEMYIKDEDWVYFTFEGNRKNSKSILQENDLAIVRSGAPGTACVITEKYSGFNAIDIIIARPDIEKINPIFMCAFTNLSHGKKQIEIGTGGAAQQHFNVSKYKEMDICLPQKELQDKFGNYVNQVDAEKQKIKRSLDQLETLKKALMQKYFG